MADLMYFPEKTGPFFPPENPLYFSAVLPFWACPKGWMTFGNLLFFTLKKRPLNCTVFSSLKWLISKNNGF